MRVAVLSDVHGNLEALQAVLADCGGQTDTIVCLGDIVGYGADPVACLELIAERAQMLVAGNHEYGATGRLPLEWFNDAAQAALEWTATQLDVDHRRFIGALALRAELDDATLVHASPLRPEEWDYLITPREGFDAFAGFASRLCFVGHSHRPGYWSLGSSGPVRRSGESGIALDHGRRYLINVGSVGQPRDRDPRAAYAVWDTERRAVAIRRVAYDLDGASRKIVKAGLPRILAERLRKGA